MKRRSYKKHQLFISTYMQKDGVVELPAHCYWMVLKHRGGGDFTNERDAQGHIALILSDDIGRGNPRSWPVISFLTEEEAKHLADILQEFATGKAQKRRPPRPSQDSSTKLGYMLFSDSER